MHCNHHPYHQPSQECSITRYQEIFNRFNRKKVPGYNSTITGWFDSTPDTKLAVTTGRKPELPAKLSRVERAERALVGKFFHFVYAGGTRFRAGRFEAVFAETHYSWCPASSCAIRACRKGSVVDSMDID
jgi:hypothetical protein